MAAVENAATTPKEVYLEADKEIPGQRFVCLSFVSPQKVLKNKDLFFFTEFLKDYEVQYKIKATETFLMEEAKKVQEAAAQIQQVLENLSGAEGGAAAKTDLQAAVESVKTMRAGLTQDVAQSLEAHVRANMKDYKESTIEEAYATFLLKNRKKLEDAFFAKNEFRTTVQGLKVRGSYDTYNEAVARAKTLQKLDPMFNVYVAQVGFWLPWDPEPSEVADQEYADDQLNTLMKKYKENEESKNEMFAKLKQERAGPAAARTGGAAGGAGAPVDAADAPPSDMFSGEDLAIRRKKEAAAAGGAAGH
jgi:hypothetical protein